MRGLDQRVDMASGSRSRRRQQLAEEGATVAVGDGIQLLQDEGVEGVGDVRGSWRGQFGGLCYQRRLGQLYKGDKIEGDEAVGSMIKDEGEKVD